VAHAFSSAKNDSAAELTLGSDPSQAMDSAGKALSFSDIHCAPTYHDLGA
jgi:hypothetical protein